MNVERTKLAVFAINGLMVAIAGLILSSRLGAGSPSAGNIAELDAIAACVIGGTSLAGGVGSVAGAVLGAFIMASLDNGMSMLDVPTFWQYIVKGRSCCWRYGWIPLPSGGHKRLTSQISLHFYCSLNGCAIQRVVCFPGYRMSKNATVLHCCLTRIRCMTARW
ncbi:Xylose transport system permease protein xylH [Serratia rubidaea]|uniref:Xylose transport system permease protein XylH n=1 Tax=Serratia rubidaea TaxID=61652 RepID=A0A4U9H7Q5_SERRU|nr:Xylose transport system permease protein xylH [Serratia rubidaea]